MALITQEKLQFSRSLMEKIYQPLAPPWDLISKHLRMESESYVGSCKSWTDCGCTKRYTLNICMFIYIGSQGTVNLTYVIRGCRWTENPSTLLEKLLRTDGCARLGGWFGWSHAHARLQARTSQLINRRRTFFVQSAAASQYLAVMTFRPSASVGCLPPSTRQ